MLLVIHLFPTRTKTPFVWRHGWGLSTSQHRTSKLSWKPSFFQNDIPVWEFAMIWIFSFHSSFLKGSTKAANKSRLDTYLLEPRKERVANFTPLRERISFKKTPFWERRMICNLWEFLVSNLTQELFPQGWAALSELETKNSLGEFLSKRKKKKKNMSCCLFSLEFSCRNTHQDNKREYSRKLLYT